MRAVLVVGCGYLGGAWLCQARQACGPEAEIWALARTPRPLGPGVRGLWGDLHDPDLAARLPTSRLDAVIFCAAADRRDAAGYRELYVEGSRRLVAALASLRQPPKRLIWTSSTGVYGHDGGEWVDESTPPEPRGWRGEIMLEAEAAVSAAPFPTTCLRLAGIYGPQRMQLAERLRAGWDPGAAGRRFTNRIHLDDCVGVLTHLLASKAPAPPLLVAADSCPVRLSEVAAYLQQPEPAPPRQLGRRRAAVERSPSSADQPQANESGPGQGKRCNNALLLSLGYALRYPSYRECFAASGSASPRVL